MSGRTGDWDKALRGLNGWRLRTDQIVSQALYRSGEIVKRNIVLGITRGRAEWPALSATTLERKFPKTKMLIDKGDLRNSITTVRAGRDVFVGIPIRARGPHGENLGSIGAPHEYGAVIKKPPGVIRVIPKRSFIRPAWKESREDVMKAMKKAAAQIIENM